MVFLSLAPITNIKTYQYVLNIDYFLKGPNGKDGEEGAAGPPGPAVSATKLEHLFNINLEWSAHIMPCLFLARALREKEANKDLKGSAVSR